MIRKHDEMNVEVREKMRGGPGSVRIQHVVDNNAMPNGRLFANITMNPGDGIGQHTHIAETEYYYIIEGIGNVTEDSGDYTVQAGDVIITGNGQSHSIVNTGSSILRMLAVIILD